MVYCRRYEKKPANLVASPAFYAARDDGRDLLLATHLHSLAVLDGDMGFALPP